MLGDDARNHRDVIQVELVRDSICRDGLHARVAEDDLFDARGSRVSIVRGTDVGVEHLPKLGNLFE